MPEDRDQLFEKALARQLRTERTSESLCLDAETLAAYHEQMLSPEEVAAAKSHIVSCVRCQEILTHLEATQEVSELTEADGVTAAEITIAAGASLPERPGTVSAREAAHRSASSEKVVAIPSKKYRLMRWAAPAGAIAAGLLIWLGLRDFRSKTMAPASSVQVAENRQQAPANSARDESKEFALPKGAEKQKAGARSADQLNEVAPSPPARPDPQGSVFDERKDSSTSGKLERQDKKVSPAYGYSTQARSGIGGGHGPSVGAGQAQANNLQRGDQVVVGGAAPAIEPVPAPADLDKAEPQKSQPALTMKSAGVSGYAKPAAPPPPPLPTSGPGRLRGMVTDPSGAAVAGASVELKSADGATAASTSTDNAGMYFFSDVNAGKYELQLQSPGFKSDTLTELNVAPGENIVNARLEVGAVSETVEVAAQPVAVNSEASQVVTKARESRGRNPQALLLASSGLQTVASPDGNAIWKFGDSGQIFHSKNAGKEWTSQTSGASVKLLAASAPSAKVCWIAGATGTLLLTTDSGKHWQKITVPIAGDLGGVHASDANHASIWDAAHHASYETADGGVTWKQVANE